MGHNRIRVVDARTGAISTLAGDGKRRGRGDGGPAAAASLGGPISLVVADEEPGMRLFIAEYFNGSVRVVEPSGIVSTLGPPGRFTRPSRLAYRAGSWLYVASEGASLTAFNVGKARPHQVATTAWRTRKRM
jgi:hypothetical protein